MASAAGTSKGGMPADSRTRPRQQASRGRLRRTAPAATSRHTTASQIADPLASVPRLRGRLRAGRTARARREWATSPRRYLVAVGWRLAHVSDNLLDLLSLIDGSRSVGELADELAARQHRPVHPAEILHLLRRRLAPKGLVALDARARAPLLASSMRSGAAAVASAPPSASALPSVALSQSGDSAAEVLSPAGLVARAAPAGANLVPTRAALDTFAPMPAGTSNTETYATKGEWLASDPALMGQTSVEPWTSPYAAASVSPSSSPNAPHSLSGSGGAPPIHDHPMPPLMPPREAPASGADMPAGRASGAVPRQPSAPVPTPAVPAPWPPGAAPVRRPPRARRARVAASSAGKALAILVGTACLLVPLVMVIWVTYPNLIPGFLHLRAVEPAAVASPTPASLRERLLPGERAYVVKSGDTLAGIAARYGVSANALLIANGDILQAPSALKPGMQLAVPARYNPRVAPAAQPRPLYYVVRRGDTLHSVAIFFGTTTSAIANYNLLIRPDALTAGQGLLIPPLRP
jgi:LysM repeat protein